MQELAGRMENFCAEHDLRILLLQGGGHAADEIARAV